MIIEITDMHIPELAVYATTKEYLLLHYYEPAPGIFIAESPNVVIRAIEAGYEPLSFLAEKEDLNEITLGIFHAHPDVPAYVCDGALRKSITGFPMTRGLLAAFRRKELPSAASVCEGKKRIVVLDNVMNPTNVGAIFRSAAALSMDAVLLTKGCCDPLYRRASRVSMGNVFLIPWTYMEISEEQPDRIQKCPSEGIDAGFAGATSRPPRREPWPQAGIQTLKRLGFKTAAMALTDRSVPVNDPRVMSEEKLAIIMGTEGFGLPDETLALCDYTVKIPMAEGVDSLNVASAAAVAFWQLGIQR